MINGANNSERLVRSNEPGASFSYSYHMYLKLRSIPVLCFQITAYAEKALASPMFRVSLRYASAALNFVASRQSKKSRFQAAHPLLFCLRVRFDACNNQSNHCSSRRKYRNPCRVECTLFGRIPNATAGKSNANILCNTLLMDAHFFPCAETVGCYRKHIY